MIQRAPLVWQQKKYQTGSSSSSSSGLSECWAAAVRSTRNAAALVSAEAEADADNQIILRQQAFAVAMTAAKLAA